MTTTPELRYFNTGEVAIHLADWRADEAAQDEVGRPEAVYLFIHGITNRHETWAEVVDEIRQGARAIAVDLRGHGRSGRASKRYEVADYARDMAALIEGLSLGPAIIVGHSLGALAAIELAATRPDLTEAIVLEDPPLYSEAVIEDGGGERRLRYMRSAEISASGLSIAGMAEMIWAERPDIDEQELQMRARALFWTDADVISGAMDQSSDLSTDLGAVVEDKMRSVQCTALLMQGDIELGGWMRADDGKRAVELMRDCRLEVWKDTGHNLHSTDPERFIRQVGEFVAGLEKAAHD